MCTIHRSRSVLLAVSLGVTPGLAQVTTEQVAVPAAEGWRAHRIYKSESGIWYARAAMVAPAYGAPDLIVTDDNGRCTVLSVYSGRWTARSVEPDHGWLAPSAPADVDPRVAGRELYVAGRHGNVHQVTVRPRAHGGWELESVEIGHVAAEEFHTIVADDLAGDGKGAELLAFAISGAVYALAPQAEPGFTQRKVATLPGRVRQAVVVPGTPPRLFGVARSGHLLEMRWRDGALTTRVITREPMGLGRIARWRAADHPVLYVTRDDGVVLRFAERGGIWNREVISVGAQGLRGIVSGRFCADPKCEAVMVFGYGKKVQLVVRRESGWAVEDVFESPDKGHWLAVGEFDGRNSTEEVAATGFGGEVVLLSRPPGFGLDARVAVLEPEQQRGASDRPIRVAIKAGEQATKELSPLNYQGGFATKTMIYQTLVRRGADGGLVPGLAASWRFDAGEKAWVFALRSDARFHDGTPVTAVAVAEHFRRWIGLPEHDWLSANRRIQRVEAVGDRQLRILVDRPCALLPALCAINPTAIAAPSSRDREGAWRRAVGSGAFAFEGVREGGRVLRYRRFRPGRERGPHDCVDLVRFRKTPDDDPIAALRRGDVDVVVSTWNLNVDPSRAAALRNDPAFLVQDGPGSSVVYLDCEDRGRARDVALRRAVAAAIDRAELVRTVEHGFADPTTGWAAPSVRIWPQGTPPRGQSVALEKPLRLGHRRAADRRLADAVAAQLTRAGMRTSVVELGEQASEADCDLTISRTHGIPYDPFLTMVTRFGPPPAGKSASSARSRTNHPSLVSLVRRAMDEVDPASRRELFVEIQRHLDRECPVVPLYAPRRLVLRRRGTAEPVGLTHDLYRLDLTRWTDR
ncbi:MAG: ABC transporter substrate-binding protein [Planctomycetes bacterium]|nr:ABC transporter substrate-binding protein [Planctomycetota bacterium]